MKLHTTCGTLKLDKFITCLIEADYSGLVIDGEPTEDQLSEAWVAIYQEYVELMGSGEDNYILVLGAEIERLRFKLLVIEQCITVLGDYYSEELVLILKKMGYDFKFSPDNTDERREDLVKITSLCKSVILKYEEKTEEFNVLSENQTAEPVTRHYFDDVLANLSKFIGSIIYPEQITVSYYTSQIKLLKKHNEILNQKTA